MTQKKKTEANESLEITILRQEVATLKAAALEKVALQAEIGQLLAEKNRTNGDKLDIPMADYKFTNIMDPGVSFTGTNGAPTHENGKNVYTRYCCDAGGIINLPVQYAKELNLCRMPANKLELDQEGNKKTNEAFSDRWIFSRIEA